MRWDAIDVTVKFAHCEESDLRLSVPCRATVAELKAQVPLYFDNLGQKKWYLLTVV